MPVYFTKLKGLWYELESLVPPPSSNYVRSKEFVTYLQRQKLYQFLMGLNDTYQPVRSQILLMIFLLTKDQTFAMILNNEG